MIRKSGASLQRSLKFDIHTELQYRVHGDTHWRKGETMTISSTEILFHGSDDLQIGAIIDIQYVLQIVPRPALTSRVRCQGEVLRSSEGSITAKVAHCRLVRG